MSQEAWKKKRSPLKGQQKGADMVPAVSVNLEQIFKVVGDSERGRLKKIYACRTVSFEQDLRSKSLHRKNGVAL